MARWEAQRARLELQLQPDTELLCVAPAYHSSADASRREKVWFGIGKSRATESHFAFLFHRRFSFCSVMCMKNLVDAVYCVVPIAENIHIEVEVNRCIFLWRTVVKKYQLTNGAACSRYGDLFVDEILDPSGYVVQVLRTVYERAQSEGVVFHEGATNVLGQETHTEIWNFRDCVPWDIARLHVTHNAFQQALPWSNSCVDLGDPDSRLQFLCITWNVGATLPNAARSLRSLLDTVWSADVVVVGLQEVCQLSALRLVQDGTEVQVWRDWVEKEIRSFNSCMELLDHVHLVGMLLMVFVHSGLRPELSDVRTASLGVGVGGVGGNKGAVAVRFTLQDDTSVCVLNAHMAAGQENYIERCQNFRDVSNKMRFSDVSGGVPTVTSPTKATAEGATLGQSLAMRAVGSEPLLRDQEMSANSSQPSQPPSPSNSVGLNDHTHVIWIGDTNSRLHWPGKLGGMPIEQAMVKVQEGRFGDLLALDQLTMMRRDGLAFQQYEEQKILFLPSYKWRPDTNEMDMRNKKHVPAWCDRVLVRSTSTPPANIDRYDMYMDLKQSDHRPVYALIGVPFGGSSPSSIERGSMLSGPGLDEPPSSDAPPEEQVFGSDFSIWSEQPSKVRLVVDPPEVVFYSVKPEEPQEVTLRVVVGDPSRTSRVCRWRAIIQPNSEAQNMSSLNSSISGNARGSVGWTEADSKTLVHSLQCTPSSGCIDDYWCGEVKLSLNFIGYVFHRRVTEACLVVKTHTGPRRESVVVVPIKAHLETSLLRLPLHALSGIGSVPLSEAGGKLVRSTRKSILRTAATTDELPCGSIAAYMPPKEVLSLMAWIVTSSSMAEPGTFRWWPEHPLADSGSPQLVARILDRLERNRALRLGLNDDPGVYIAGVQLLLRWLLLLPDPIVGQQILALSIKKGNDVALRRMASLPRSVLVCLTSMLISITDRHGPCSEATRRFAVALTQLGGSPGHGFSEALAAGASSTAEGIQATIARRLRRDGCQDFPPRETLLFFRLREESTE